METIGSIFNQIPKFFNQVQIWLNELMTEYKWVADQIGSMEIYLEFHQPFDYSIFADKYYECFFINNGLCFCCH